MTSTSAAVEGAGQPITLTWHPDTATTSTQLAQGPNNIELSLAGAAVVVRRAVRPESHADEDNSGGRAVTIRTGHAGEAHLEVHARTWDQAWDLAGEPLLGLVAYHSGLLYQRAAIVEGAGQTLLVFNLTGRDVGPTSQQVLLDASTDTVTAHIASPRAWRDGDLGSTVSMPVAATVLLTDETDTVYASPKQVRACLRAHGGARRSRLAAMIGGVGAIGLLADIDAVAEAHLHSLSVCLPAACVPAADLPIVAAEGVGLPRAAQFPVSALAGLREMQDTAVAVYGRLEVERALAWTAEELGELAQVLRRRESPARVREELGQLFTWVLNLANIADVDLATGAQRALGDEVGRQLTTHRELRPYHSSPFRTPR